MVFDPANHLAFWPRRFESTKVGLVGGALNIANVGSFSQGCGPTQDGAGFDLVAYVVFSRSV